MNCVVEKTRRKSEFSIAEAAAAIGIPRKLIDVRHGKWFQLITKCFSCLLISCLFHNLFSNALD